MKQILWFRRDLRINDNAILSNALDEVFPIFIFDKNILEKLPKDDKRVTFIYKSVLNLKKKLQSIGLDLAIFYDYPINVFTKLQNNFDEVLCSCDFDSYAIRRDKEMENILPLKRFYDSFLIHPNDGLKIDGTAYKVFTPFYKNLKVLWASDTIKEYKTNQNLKLYQYNYTHTISLNALGFKEQKIASFLEKNAFVLLDEFKEKISKYQEDRDFFTKDATSKISVHLRFGTISPRQIFNTIKKHPSSEFFIRELFWREFYSYILYHFPKSEYFNFKGKNIDWNENEKYYKAWCDGDTGVPIIDAAMQHLNQTGLMHNRLRMVIASFLTKNLFLPWQWGEKYFALKLLDYETSSNIGSWQWSASTGADSVPYFRVFNPYTQSTKFDKEGLFIKSVLTDLQDIEPKLLHKEDGLQTNLFLNYPKAIVDIKESRAQAIQRFKYANT